MVDNGLMVDSVGKIAKLNAPIDAVSVFCRNMNMKAALYLTH